MSDNSAMSQHEAEMIKDAARAFVKSESSLAVARKAEQGDWTQAHDSWVKLAELGWLELLRYPEERQMGVIASCLIAEQLGRGAYTMPFVESACVALPLLAKNFESLEQTAELCSGTKKVALAMPLSGLPQKASRLPELSESVQLTAYQLEHADLLLIPAQSGGESVLVLASRPEAGWDSKPMPDLSNNANSLVNISDLSQIQTVVVSWQSLHEAFECYRLATAAYIVGLASEAIDMAVEYAKERIAFDKPIGSFQAVQQRLAESTLELAAARLLVQEASVSGETIQVPMACMQACEAGTKATFTAQQIWGGMAYSMEVDVQLFFRRARAQQLMLGQPWEIRHRIWEDVVPH